MIEVATSYAVQKLIEVWWEYLQAGQIEDNVANWFLLL